MAKKSKTPTKNEVVKEIQTRLRDKSAAAKVKFATREEWLEAVAKKMAPWFAAAGKPLPKTRVSIGFTSMGGKGKRIGECWTTKAAADGAAHIFIVPTLQDSTRIAGILAHELIHAAIGIEAGHGPKFKAMMAHIGLEGKATATSEGALFKTNFAPILKECGPIPHVMLQGKSNRPKKQATRMIKCECPKCGYVARTTQKWIDKAGKPVCPDHLVVMK